MASWSTRRGYSTEGFIAPQGLGQTCTGLHCLSQPPMGLGDKVLVGPPASLWLLD